MEGGLIELMVSAWLMIVSVFVIIEPFYRVPLFHGLMFAITFMATLYYTLKALKEGE